MDEYRDTGWYNVECTCDGRFRRNGRKLTPRSYSIESPFVVVKVKGERPKQKTANILVAKVWHPDYVEGCNIIPKDGNQKNLHISNLHIADMHEFASYRAERRKNPNAGVSDMSKYGEFRQTPIKGLFCTMDGVFKRSGRIVQLQKGKRARGKDGLLYVKYVNEDGDWTSTTAARIVAQTWSPQTWDENCVITYKDGNPRNIHSDNLVLVDAHKYYVQKGRMIGKGNMCDFKRAKEIVERRAKESQIALRYFQSGCLDEFNDYVKTYLNKYVCNCVDNYGYKPQLKRYLLSEVLAILYDWVLCNRPLTSYSLFCRKLVRTYMKERNFGIYNITPKPIAREHVSQLNLESLCEKYRSTKIK